MRMLITGCAVTVAVATALSAGTAASAGSAATPVSSAAASHRADQIALLAGDSRWLVYAQIPTLGNGTVDTTDAQVVADDKAGAPEAVGTLPILDREFAQQYSLEGSVLTTTSYTITPPDNFQPIVEWWNLSDHTSGTGDTTDSDTYIGSSSDGWLYSDGDTLYDESTAGVVRTVDAAVPFGSGSHTITSGSVGPHGVVLVGSNNQVTYLAYSGQVERLAFNRKPPGYHSFAQCGGTTANETICADEPVLQVSDIRRADVSTPLVVRELPLDGSSGLAAPDSCAGTGVTYDDPDYTNTPGQVSGIAFASRLVCADEFISSRTGGTARVRRSTYRIGDGYLPGDPSILDSLGHAVVTNHAHDSIETVTSATAPPRLLLAAPPSPVTVGSFALSPGRVAWTADPPASAAGTENTMSTATISASGSVLVKGATHRGATGVGWSFVAASGENSAYEVRKTVHGVGTWVVHVVSPYRTTKITRIKPVSISMSGNRMLYLTTAEPGAPRGRYLLLDVDTGRSRRVHVLEGNEDPASLAPHLWGSEVLYAGTYSSLELLNLNTDKARSIPVPNGFDPSSPYFDPLIYGSEVAWQAGRPDGEEDGVITRTTDLKHPIVLGPDEFVYALTNDGAITYPWSASDPSRPLSLRGYRAGDPSTSLGIDDTPESSPQLDSGVLAWRTQEYQLQVAAIPEQPLTPLYLGAPYAPSTLSVRPGNGWAFTLPYSAPLTACQMVIRHATTTIRSLPCVASAMKLGDESGSWDATNGSGRTVRPGVYTWTATVSGTSGTTETRNGTITVN